MGRRVGYDWSPFSSLAHLFDFKFEFAADVLPIKNNISSLESVCLSSASAVDPAFGATCFWTHVALTQIARSFRCGFVRQRFLRIRLLVALLLNPVSPDSICRRYYGALFSEGKFFADFDRPLLVISTNILSYRFLKLS